MSAMRGIDPPSTSGAAKEQSEILIRGVYETGVVEWRLSRSVLSRESTWFATACRHGAFMEGETGVITVPLTKSPDFDEDADNLDAFSRMMRFFKDDFYYLNKDLASSFAQLVQIHAMLYAIADKYDVPRLQSLASDFYDCYLRLSTSSGPFVATLGQLHPVVDMVGKSEAFRELRPDTAKKVSLLMGNTLWWESDSHTVRIVNGSEDCVDHTYWCLETGEILFCADCMDRTCRRQTSLS
ncbi:hypothetical protein MBLNU457_7683t1 [Dothideomycetes sp. NU457]